MARSMASASLALLMILCPVVQASMQGVDNNWLVKVTGQQDANGCFRVTSVMRPDDPVTNSPVCTMAAHADVVCASGFPSKCKTYKSSAITKPDTIGGCTFDPNTANATTATGYAVDRLCYDNFIVKQENYNNGVGLAPDGINMRTSTPHHTRACLLVEYCATTGYNLVTKKTGGGNYELHVELEKGENGGGKMFDHLLAADYDCSTTKPTASPESASEASQWRSAPTLLMAVAVWQVCQMSFAV